MGYVLFFSGTRIRRTVTVEASNLNYMLYKIAKSSSSSRTSTAASNRSTLFGSRRRWSDKCIITMNGLVQQQGTRRSINGKLSLVHCLILNQSISLWGWKELGWLDWKKFVTYFHITRPSVKVQMQVLNLSKLPKFVLNLLFCSLFVYVGHKNYPTFNSCPDMLRMNRTMNRCEKYTNIARPWYLYL